MQQQPNHTNDTDEHNNNNKWAMMELMAAKYEHFKVPAGDIQGCICYSTEDCYCYKEKDPLLYDTLVQEWETKVKPFWMKRTYFDS